MLDAIELTLILKAAGFRLESLDFSLAKNERNEAANLKIDIQCHKSGIVSKLVYKPVACSCPDAEAALNNSFWEVQASTPSNSHRNVGAKLNVSEKMCRIHVLLQWIWICFHYLL